MKNVTRWVRFNFLKKDLVLARKMVTMLMLPVLVFSMSSMNILAGDFMQASAADEEQVASAPEAAPAPAEDVKVVKEEVQPEVAPAPEKSVTPEEAAPAPKVEAPAEVTVTPTPEETVTPEEITPTPVVEAPAEVIPTPVVSSSPEEITPATQAEPAPVSDVVAAEATASPAHSSDWTFENVELGKEYSAPQNSGVKLTFTKLPTQAGSIKIEEITLTQEQREQTGALSDKAYDITSDMENGTFSYNLSLPIPKSSKGKTVEVKFSEELGNIGSAEKVMNTLVTTDTAISVKSLNHFTVFFTSAVITDFITDIAGITANPAGVVLRITGSGFSKFVSSNSTTAGETDLSKITYDALPSTAATIVSATQIDVVFNTFSVGTAAGELIIAAGTVKDTLNATNLPKTITNITDNAKPVLKYFTFSTSDGTTGLDGITHVGPDGVINITANYSENIADGSTITVNLNNAAGGVLLSEVFGDMVSGTYTVGATDQSVTGIDVSEITAQHVVDLAAAGNTNNGTVPPIIQFSNSFIDVTTGVAASVSIDTVAAVTDITVPIDTLLNAVGLPTSVDATLSDTTIRSFPVTWDGGEELSDGRVYDGTAGSYFFLGTLTMPVDGSVINPISVLATANVIVGDGGAANATITVTGPSPMVVGTTRTFTATDQNGNPIVTGLRWFSHPPSSGIVTVNSITGEVTALAPGVTSIFADNGSVSSNFFDLTVTAVGQVTHIVTYIAGANGSVTGTLDQTVNAGASATAVTAVADPGFHFTSWDDGVLTASRTDTSVIGNITATANFESDLTGDVTPAVITLNGPEIINITVGGTYTELGATAFDLVDGDITANIITLNFVDTTTAGSYFVFYDIYDAALNFATVTRTVNVSASSTDTTPPNITIAPYIHTPTNQNITVNASTNEGTLNVTSHVFTANHSFTFTATDAAGNQATSIVTITNIDKIAPTITAPANVSVPTDAGVSFATNVALGVPITADNVAVTLVTNDAPTSFPFFGNTIVTWKATDAAGNFSTATQTVTVIDNEKPVITLNGVTLNIEVNGIYTELGATASDNVDGSFPAIASGTVDTTTLGSYIITYNATDVAGNVADPITRTVNVVADATAPVITLLGTPLFTIEVGAAYSDAGATALDGVDGDLTASIVQGGTFVDSSNAGTFTITYNVSDFTGNAATEVTRTIKVAALDQFITFGVLNGKTYGDAPFTVSATASSGLAVAFSIVSGPATILGNTITITGAGMVVVRASQVGGGNFNAASDMDQSFTVSKAAGPAAPGAPVKVSETSSRVTLTANGLLEFSRNGGATWQGNVFTGLKSSTAYTFVARVRETATNLASVASAGTIVKTDKKSSSSHKGKKKSSKKKSSGKSSAKKKMAQFAAFLAPQHQAAYRAVAAIKRTNAARFADMQRTYKKYVNASGKVKANVTAGIRATINQFASYNGFTKYLTNKAKAGK